MVTVRHTEKQPLTWAGFWQALSNCCDQFGSEQGSSPALAILLYSSHVSRDMAGRGASMTCLALKHLPAFKAWQHW
jgi:hypothetical protein